MIGIPCEVHLDDIRHLSEETSEVFRLEHRSFVVAVPGDCLDVAAFAGIRFEG